MFDVSITIGTNQQRLAAESWREALYEVFPHGWRLCWPDDLGACRVDYIGADGQPIKAYVQALISDDDELSED